jgi:cellulose synthase/poly-beta-1,6-N-acetylglucosamine synthase-like glycosyltransferase
LLVASDGERAVEQQVRRHRADAFVGLVRGAHPGAARNFLLDHATGRLVWFLDDDVVVRPGTLRRLIELADENPDAAVFGGPNLTPPGSTTFEGVQGAVLASVVGSGPVRRRWGRHPASWADERYFILCNLAVRRELMGRFVPELVCGEENALLAELARGGHRMRYDPAIAVFHARRSTLRGFASQMHKYGRGRGQVTRRRPSEAPAAHFAPAAFVLYLLVSPVLLLLAAPYLWAPFLVYGTAVATQSVKSATTLRRPTAAPLAALLIVVLHIAYGTGTLRGIAVRPQQRSRTGTAEFTELTAAAEDEPLGSVAPA